MQLRFWGVRGSLATPGPAYVKYGGNTPCLEIGTSAGETFLFDCGTGLREMGAFWRRTSLKPASVRIFLTHFHWDHIQGLPYFEPLFTPGTTFYFHTQRPPEEARALLAQQMTAPFFPVEFDAVASRTEFLRHDRDAYASESSTVRAFEMNHPQGACGYRVEHGGKAIVYASDLEHGNAKFDRVLRENADGADVLIYDAQYTPAEYEGKRGWGHSTWEEAVRVASDCRVGQLFLFHHDPLHSDQFFDETVIPAARSLFANTQVAREGEVVEV